MCCCQLHMRAHTIAALTAWVRLMVHCACTLQEYKYSEGLSDLQGSNITPVALQRTLWRDPLSGLRTYRSDFTIDRGLSFEVGYSWVFYKTFSESLWQHAVWRNPGSF
jgi:hypothetical protein